MPPHTELPGAWSDGPVTIHAMGIASGIADGLWSLRKSGRHRRTTPRPSFAGARSSSERQHAARPIARIERHAARRTPSVVGAIPLAWDRRPLGAPAHARPRLAACADFPLRESPLLSCAVPQATLKTALSPAFLYESSPKARATYWPGATGPSSSRLPAVWPPALAQRVTMLFGEPAGA